MFSCGPVNGMEGDERGIAYTFCVCTGTDVAVPAVLPTNTDVARRLLFSADWEQSPEQPRPGGTIWTAEDRSPPPPGSSA